MKSWLRKILPASWYDGLALRWRALRNPPVFDCDEPHLPVEARAKLLEELRGCKVFLEFGSGGSTLTALKHGCTVVSIESDRNFARALARGAKGISNGRLHLIAVNIGETVAWGEPLDKTPTPNRLRRWRRYPLAPWPRLRRLMVTPDLIFIDGRFRVACALESLLQLPADSSCGFLFDDFEQYGDAYAPVLAFAREIERHGRAIFFRKAAEFDADKCRAVLAQHYVDFR